MNGFKEFLLRGNVVSMAVGLAVGAAFTSLVTGFTQAFLTPLIGLATGAVGDYSKETFSIGRTHFPIGLFITAVISFVLTALVLYFLVVMPMNRLQQRFTVDKPAEPQVTRDCPECLSAIPVAARRCAHCTSVVPAAGKPVRSVPV